jgi:hypothetical protein
MKIRFHVGDKVRSRTRLGVSETERDLIGVVVERNAFNEYLIAWPNGSMYWIQSRHLLGAR